MFKGYITLDKIFNHYNNLYVFYMKHKIRMFDKFEKVQLDVVCQLKSSTI